MEIVIPICLILGAITCVATPIVSYLRAYERGKRMWPRTFVRTYRVGEGAYRSMLVREERSVFAPPQRVDVVAATSAFLGMMWLPALPFVGIGLLVESDKGVGPALVFGVTGIVLSIAILCTGPGLLERKIPRSARFVARWSIVHNGLLLCAIAYATAVWVFHVGDPLHMQAVEPWEMYALDNVVAVGALAYAIASIVHAFGMLRAADAVLANEDDAFVLVSPLDPPAPEPAPACSSPSFQSSSAPPS